jgi:3-deoxy-D-manno-octulosonic-acid transferase
VIAVGQELPLAEAVRRLVEDPDARRRLASAAHACVAESTGALARTLEVLTPYLGALGARDAVATGA